MKKKPTNAKIEVRGTEISVVQRDGEDYISLTDMLRAKDGEFFISDWLCNRNTIEFLGIWETVYNPNFNSGEFATIKSQAGLNSFTTFMIDPSLDDTELCVGEKYDRDNKSLRI